MEWGLTVDIALEEGGFGKGQNGLNEILASSLDRDVQRLEHNVLTDMNQQARKATYSVKSPIRLLSQ